MPQAAEVPAVPLGYKRTEVGTIPDDWDVWSIGQLGILLKGKGIKRDDVSTDGAGCVRYGELYTLYDDYIVAPQSRIPLGVAASALPIRYGDLLFAGSGETAEEIGKCAAYLADEDAFAGGDIIVLRTSGPNAVYLGHLFNHQIVARQKARFGQGDAVVHISARNLATVKAPLPPGSAEQDAIADALLNVDGLLRALDALIAKKQAIKQTAMQQLLTGKTRLPGFGGGWERKRLGDHVAFLRTGVNARAELASEGTVKYLHYGDIHTSAKLRLNVRNAVMPCLPEERAGNLDRLSDGDVVFVDASEDLDGVGKSVEITGSSDAELVAGMHTIATRFDKSVLADGFKAYLQFCPAFRGHLRRLAAGTKVYATSWTHVASVELYLPDTDEQNAIATVLADIDTEITALECRREKTRAIKLGMMQQLLTGRVRLITPRPTTVPL